MSGDSRIQQQLYDNLDKLAKFEAVMTERRFELSPVYGSFDSAIRQAVYSCYYDQYISRLQPEEYFADRRLSNTISHWCFDPGSKLITLSRELIDDLENTKAPEDTTFGEISHPYPSYCVALPIGAIQLENGNSVTFVFIRVTKKGERFNAPKQMNEIIGKEPINDPMPENNVSMTVLTNGAHQSLMHTFEPSNDCQLAEGMGTTNWADDGILAFQKVSERIHSMLCHLCLYLSSKPDDVEEGERIRNVPRPGFMTLPELPKSALWRPTQIGEKYAKSLLASHDGRSPRMHLRRKHWKRQPHGEGLKLRKWIQVSMTWVNAPKTET